ncbi:hypothetical protein L6R52_39630, partial [Myxococcota bacterium]|nr:hypothetical protein [Myxococcota bacterium]
MRLMTLLSTSALLLTAACGAPTRPVTGTLDLTAHGRSTATLVAVRDDGAVKEAEVRRDGRFEIELEVGHDHALAFRSDDGGRDVTFANVVVKSEHRRSSRLRATDDAALELGELELEHGAEAIETCDGQAGASDSTIVVATAGEHDVGDDHGGDALGDQDDDGRPDLVDDDVDGDGRCDDHGANSGADSASDQADDHGANSGADSASD